MNKIQLFNRVLAALDDIYLGAVDAANRAHAAATSEESVAENKYDTFGLEASYLAQGQSQRVAQCQADIDAFKQLAATIGANQPSVSLGSLIAVVDQNDAEHYFLLGPGAGGLKFTVDHKEIICITPSAPIGQAMLGKQVDEEFEVNIEDHKHCYEIFAIY